MPAFTSPEQATDKLTRLMLVAVPPNEKGQKTLTKLARLMDVSKWAMRKWINAGKIPPDRAMEIVRIGDGRVKIEDFHEFVYKP